MLNSKSENIKTILKIADKPWSVIITKLKLGNFSGMSIEELLNTCTELKLKNTEIDWSDLTAWALHQEIVNPRIALKSSNIKLFNDVIKSTSSLQELRFVTTIISVSLQNGVQLTSHDTMCEYVYTLATSALEKGMSLTDIVDAFGIYTRFKPVFLLADHVINHSKSFENWVNSTTINTKGSTSAFWDWNIWVLHKNINDVRDIIMKRFIFESTTNAIPQLINAKSLIDSLVFTTDKNENKALESYVNTLEFYLEDFPEPVLKWLSSDDCNWSTRALSDLVEFRFKALTISNLVSNKEFSKLAHITEIVKKYAHTVPHENRMALLYCINEQSGSSRYVQYLYPTVKHKPILRWLYLFPEYESQLLNLDTISDLTKLNDADEYEWDQYIRTVIFDIHIESVSLPDIEIGL